MAITYTIIMAGAVMMGVSVIACCNIIIIKQLKSLNNILNFILNEMEEQKGDKR